MYYCTPGIEMQKGEVVSALVEEALHDVVVVSVKVGHRILRGVLLTTHNSLDLEDNRTALLQQQPKAESRENYKCRSGHGKLKFSRKLTGRRRERFSEIQSNITSRKRNRHRFLSDQESKIRHLAENKSGTEEDLKRAYPYQKRCQALMQSAVTPISPSTCLSSLKPENHVFQLPTGLETEHLLHPPSVASNQTPDLHMINGHDDATYQMRMQTEPLVQEVLQKITNPSLKQEKGPVRSQKIVASEEDTALFEALWVSRQEQRVFDYVRSTTCPKSTTSSRTTTTRVQEENGYGLHVHDLFYSPRPSSSRSKLVNKDCIPFKVNDVVWAKLADRPWWPAKVLSLTTSEKGRQHTMISASVQWLGRPSKVTDMLPSSLISPFAETFHQYYSPGKKAKPYVRAIEEALRHSGFDPCITLINVPPPSTAQTIDLENDIDN